MKKQKIATVAVFIVLFIVMMSATKADTGIDKVKQMLDYRLNNENASVGISAAIIEGDNVSYLNVGVINKANNTQTASNHLFEIGSISKTFTTIALASMVKEGKVKLTDTAQQYLPESVKLSVFKDKPITLLSLANHTSGLPRLPDNLTIADPLDPYADYSVEQLYAFLNKYQLSRAVGTQTEYSNLGTGLLGHILSLVDGKSYEQVIADRVFKPLKMNSSYVDIPADKMAMLSDGHNGELNKTKHWNIPTLAGAGAIKSSAEDMVKYLQANMVRNSSPAIALAQEETASFIPDRSDIGLGWIINSFDNDQKYYWHNGGTGGFRSYMGYDKNSQKGIVILSNSIFPMDDIGDAYLTGQLDVLIEKSTNEYFVPVVAFRQFRI